MGREVRRVPVDFDWPINKVWQGFLMPERLQCPDCESCGGAGTTTARRWVVACANMLLMLDDDLREQQLGRRMHPYFDDFYTTAYGTRPSPDIREFGTGLAGREGGFDDHDAIDGWRASKKIISAAGLDPDVWGICQECGGKGCYEAYPGQSAEAEAWKPTDPPAGDGWQVWETVSEGSPISPVFPDREGLIGWLMSPAYSWGTSRPLTREQAAAFTESGWAPTFIASAATGLVNGEQFPAVTR